MKPFLLFLALWGASVAFCNEPTATTSATLPVDQYPLTTCVVSGDKLGQMGNPVKYVYKQDGEPGRAVEFCCQDCIQDFEKAPAKFMAKLEAAAAVSEGGAAVAPALQADLVKSYIPIAEALAGDDLAKAKSAAAALARQADAGGASKVSEAAIAISNAETISVARQGLKTLSVQIEPLARRSKAYVVMHCPMANADWVQTDTNVRNPYYGKMMLTCGEPKEGN